MTYSEKFQCTSIYLFLDCLTNSDLVVQAVLAFVSICILLKVVFRLRKLYKGRNFTKEQLIQVKYSKILYWHLVVYIFSFIISLMIAIVLCVYIKYNPISQTSTENWYFRFMGKMFWISLYCYVFLLNLIFIVIAYIFMVRSRYLNHQNQSRTIYLIFCTAWVIQILSFTVQIFLIWAYKQNQQPDKFRILKIINLILTVLCTIALSAIFYFIYRKIRKASTIAYLVKKKQTFTVFILLVVHSLRVLLESLNLFLQDQLCKWRWDYKQPSSVFTFYIAVAHIFINIGPMLVILYCFKPPKAQFSQSLITASLNTGSYS